MMYVKKDHPKLYHELFKPSDYLQQNIDLHLNNIGTNYWSYTFRFGNYFGDFREFAALLGGKDFIFHEF